jgi:hypothetical protein
VDATSDLIGGISAQNNLAKIDKSVQFIELLKLEKEFRGLTKTWLYIKEN